MSIIKFRKVRELFPNCKVRIVRTEQLWLGEWVSESAVIQEFSTRPDTLAYAVPVPQAQAPASWSKIKLDPYLNYGYTDTHGWLPVSSYESYRRFLLHVTMPMHAQRDIVTANLSVRLSVTRSYCIEINAHIIVKLYPRVWYGHDS